MKLLRSITNILQKVEIYFGAAAVMAIFILTTMGIVMRYFFNRPLSWCEEVIIYMFIWTGFLAVSYTLSKDNHVRFSLLLDKIPDPCQSVLLAVMDILIAAVFVVLLPSAIRCIAFLLNTPAMKIPEKYFYYIVPVGYCLIIFHSAVNMLSRFFPEKKTDITQNQASDAEKKAKG